VNIAYVIAGVLVVATVCFAVRYFVQTRKNFGGGRVVICPENQQQAMVEIDARRAGLTSLFGKTEIRLESCWRWPLKEDCGQECLLQLSEVDNDCLVRSVLMKWYQGKKCAFCQRPFSEVELIDHKPVLFNPEGFTVEWAAIPISAVNEAMATYLPVCWNCHVAQTFHREHPELVVERNSLSQHQAH
jgi:hypothetical protein